MQYRPRAGYTGSGVAERRTTATPYQLTFTQKSRHLSERDKDDDDQSSNADGGGSSSHDGAAGAIVIGHRGSDTGDDGRNRLKTVGRRTSGVARWHVSGRRTARVGGRLWAALDASAVGSRCYISMKAELMQCCRIGRDDTNGRKDERFWRG